MATGLRHLVRFTLAWLASIRWTPRRTLIVVAYFVLVPLFEALIWVGLLLDRVLFPRYRAQRVDAPVFVVGNFRSGTTRLHRLLAGDRSRFTTMKMWEVLFAPSITQRRIVSALVAFDRLLGRPFARALLKLESYWGDANVMHEVSLAQPEEDEYLCLHVWSALTIGLSSGVLDEARPYVRFDQLLPAREKTRVMSFYASCVQRHLHAHAGAAGARQYLAKNPALTPKLDSLYDTFPDAKVICLVRNPLEVVPSFVSMMKFSWSVMGAQENGNELRDFVIELAKHWYRYPLERLSREPDDRHAIVVYDDLVADPEGTVRGIYSRFGFGVDEEFARLLAEEAGRAADYRSRHDYGLEDLGMTREAFVAEFEDVFERFGFDRGADPDERATEAGR